MELYLTFLFCVKYSVHNFKLNILIILMFYMQNILIVLSHNLQAWSDTHIMTQTLSWSYIILVQRSWVETANGLGKKQVVSHLHLHPMIWICWFRESQIKEYTLGQCIAPVIICSCISESSGKDLQSNIVATIVYGYACIRFCSSSLTNSIWG